MRYNETYRRDCHFYNEIQDMGAIIQTCSYGPVIWGKCECLNCKNYLSNIDAANIITEFLKKRQ